jgi:hypothetical protein
LEEYYLLLLQFFTKHFLLLPHSVLHAQTPTMAATTTRLR